MKKSVKAALYSGLLFPGTGHFSLDRYPRGLIFFVPAFVSIVFLLHNALSQAYAVVDQIERGEISSDHGAITSLISNAPGGSGLLMLKIATWVWMICWFGALIDAYRLGKQVDNAKSEQA